MLELPARHGGAELESVEERSVEPDRASRKCREPRRERVGARDADARRGAQPALTHEREVHGRGDRGDRLVGADVAGGLLAADVLLACLQRVHEAASAVRVARFADEASGHLPDEGLTGGEDAEVRAA